MQTYQVSIPSIEEDPVEIEAESPARAGLRLLRIKSEADPFDSDESIEVVVTSQSGRRFVLSAEPFVSFRIRKVS